MIGSEQGTTPSAAAWRTLVLCLSVIVASAGLPAGLAAQERIITASSDSSILVEQSTRLKALSPIFTSAFLPGFGDDLKVTSIIQRFPIDPRALDHPSAKGKAKATLDCYSLSSGQFQRIGTQNGKFDRYGNRAFGRRIAGSENCDDILLEWDLGGGQKQPAGTSVNARTVVQRIAEGADPGCFDVDTLCLGEGNRFKVEIDWRDAGRSGSAIPLATGVDSGTFFFFDPDNVQLVLKVLDGCAANDHFWVFAGALTDVEVDITVTDTRAGDTRLYTNPLNSPFQPITDTQAFATCP